jgi:hypothetical protein
MGRRFTTILVSRRIAAALSIMPSALEVARTPAMAALAHYNLGLVGLERGAEAARATERSTTGDERIAGLAACVSTNYRPPRRSHGRCMRAPARFRRDQRSRARSTAQAAAKTTPSANTAVGEQFFGRDWRVDAAAALLNYGDLDGSTRAPSLSAGALRGRLVFEPGLYGEPPDARR